MMIFSEKIFEGESFVSRPKTPTSKLVIPLRLAKDVQTEMHIKAVVGYRSSVQVQHALFIVWLISLLASSASISR